MIIYKNIIIEDWAIKEIEEAMDKIYSTPEKKKRLQEFEMAISEYYLNNVKVESNKDDN